MSIEKGKIYTNFGGSEVYRAVNVYKDKNDQWRVELANLMPPGGKTTKPLAVFKANFTEQVEVVGFVLNSIKEQVERTFAPLHSKIDGILQRHAGTDLRFRSQAHNPYAPGPK